MGAMHIKLGSCACFIHAAWIPWGHEARCLWLLPLAPSGFRTGCLGPVSRPSIAPSRLPLARAAPARRGRVVLIPLAIQSVQPVAQWLSSVSDGRDGTAQSRPGQVRVGGRASKRATGGRAGDVGKRDRAGRKEQTSRPADQQIRPVVAAAAGTTGPRGHAYTVRAGERAYVRARLEPRALSGSTIQGLDTSRAANKRNLVGFLEQKISLCAPAGKPHAPPHGRHPGECASECASKRTTCGVVAVVKGRINNRDASCGRCKPTMNPLRGRHARPWHVGCASRGGAAAHRSSQKQGRPGHNGQRARGRRARADRRQACKPACKRASRQAARQKVHDATDQEREEMLGAPSSQRTPKQRASRTSRGGPSNGYPSAAESDAGHGTLHLRFPRTAQ